MARDRKVSTYDIDSFTEFAIVFGKFKKARVVRDQVREMEFNNITRSLVYKSSADSFMYYYNVDNFMIKYEGRSEDIKNLECTKVIFYRDGQELGTLRVDNTITPRVGQGIVEIRSGII